MTSDQQKNVMDQQQQVQQHQNHQEVVDFDEALERVGFGKFNYILIVLAGVLITTTTFETIGISFVFPVAECDLSLTTQNKGVLSGITSIGIIISSHFWGFLADQRGRKTVIVPTLILSFLASFMSSLASNFTTLVICRFICGFFIAGSSATIFAYLGEFHSSKVRSKVFMAASFIYGLASNYMPVLGFLILNRPIHFHVPIFNIIYKPWRFYLLMCGLPSLLCAIILFFFPESPKFKFSKGDEEATLNILKKIHRINNPKDVVGYNVTKVVEDVEFIDNDSREINNVSENPILMLWKQTCLLFSNKNAKNMVILCLMQCGLFGSCHGLYMFFPEIVDKLATFSNQYPDGRKTICEIFKVEDTTMTNATKYSTVISHNVNVGCSETFEIETFFHSLILEILYMVGFLLITFIINRTSKLSILWVILFGCSFSGFATLFVKIPLLSVYIYVIFMLLFLSVNVVNAATVDLFPTNLRGMAINISMMFGRIGSVMGTNIIGFTLDNYCSVTFAVSASIMSACGVLAFFIPNIRKIDGKNDKTKL
ncbi:hypothetical protein PVAND_005259 [Polypedilum vanderplanki]|uniref:Major facilitator superfamily (MFS) profile domain-containing protein n=1 Tax=Polypedilum vanderplanki TaxID=319348 RepID=A0A9J6C1J1_POLVA|nr:hypothetical protein PVAND_005259 [Polypedilum vanderplanki]